MTDAAIAMFVAGCFVGVFLCAVSRALRTSPTTPTVLLNPFRHARPIADQPHYADRPVEPIPPCATDHESMRALGEGLIEIAQFLADRQSSVFELKPTQTTKIVDRCLSAGNVILVMYPKKKAKLAVTEHTVS